MNGLRSVTRDNKFGLSAQIYMIRSVFTDERIYFVQVKIYFRTPDKNRRPVKCKLGELWEL